MSRTEYMRELDALLQGISKEEREEAMQYYNDYFDDAGSENEEKVIEELGSPAKLADTIRAGVNGNTGEAESYGEYGERGYRDCRFDTSESPARREGYYEDSYSETYGESQSQNDRNPFSERQYSYTANSNQGYTYAGNQRYGAGQTTEMPRKKSSAGKIILIICILVIGLPIVVPTALGLLLAAFGVLVALAISAIAIWMAAVATAVVGILLGIHGFGQLFYSPVLGIGMLGVGCLLLALGAVFTVLIGWGCIKLIPMMFRGFVNLCRRPFQKKRGECR